MNKKFIFLVFIGLFFGCLGASKLANYYFNLSSDYLTATATFFTAFIALYLYSDWRQPHKVMLIEKELAEIRKNIIDFRVQYFDIRFFINSYQDKVLTNEEEIAEKYFNKEHNFLNSIDVLLDNLSFYEKNFDTPSKSEKIIKHNKLVEEAISELMIVYTYFTNKDPNKEFKLYFSEVFDMANTGKFINVVNLLTVDLNDSMSEIKEEIIDLKIR